MFRSLLFIPANNPSMLQNADIFICDGIIFDLEDAIPIKDKDNARHLLETYLNSNQSYPKTICLRVNDVFSPYIDEDLNLLSTKKIDYIVCPKANLKSLVILDKKLKDLEHTFQLDEIPVICLIEETAGIIDVDNIAAHERVKGLILGAEDLASELEIERSKSGIEIDYPRSKIIYASTHQNIISIDTPFTDIEDLDGLKQDCQHAKQLGMKAKTAIHPSQLEMINDVFSPSKSMIEWAQGVMHIYEHEGKSLFQYQGKMIDKPVIERAKKVIKKAKLFNLLS